MSLKYPDDAIQSLASSWWVVDPTDTQVADADNLGQWYGLDHEAARNFRAMLRGELSSERWQKTKTALG